MDFFPGLKSWKWLVPIFVILALFLYLFAGDPELTAKEHGSIREWLYSNFGNLVDFRSI